MNSITKFGVDFKKKRSYHVINNFDYIENGKNGDFKIVLIKSIIKITNVQEAKRL